MRFINETCSCAWRRLSHVMKPCSVNTPLYFRPNTLFILLLTFCIIIIGSGQVFLSLGHVISCLPMMRLLLALSVQGLKLGLLEQCFHLLLPFSFFDHPITGLQWTLTTGEGCMTFVSAVLTAGADDLLSIHRFQNKLCLDFLP